MSIASGTRIGPYQVTSRIGEGGMGVVYRALDTQLQRDVALKVLPDHFANDTDRLERFQREAQLLASLNHPNIAHIYGLERTGGAGCIVMELVEGETLAERVQRGPIPIDDALQIAREIAEALEAAHAQDIVHRDLKPANIKLTPDGKVKVLDFGLAKALSGRPELDPSNSPTIMSGSIPGVVMGTAGYMSPEQARGKAVDARTDIWAFGCVLYEMLSARRAFDGDTATDIVAKIIQGEPQWDLLPADVPSSIRTLLKIVLSKDPRQRLQHMGDARVLFNHTFVPETPKPTAPPARAGRRVWLVRAAVSLAFLAAFVPASLYFLRVPEEPSEIRFEMPAPGIINESLRVSPDGRYVAYVAITNGKREVWVRSIGAVSAQPLPGTENSANYLLGWAPDSRRLAFFADGKLKKIDITGGSPLAIADTNVVAMPGSWNTNGDILFSALFRDEPAPVIARVSDSGGAVTAITSINRSDKEVGHFGPTFLPDGRRFLYARPTVTPNSQWQVVLYSGSLDSTSITRLRSAGTYDSNSPTGTGSPNVYISFGYWLSLVNGTLLAERMNADGTFDGGEPVRLADNVAGFSASDKLLLYRQAVSSVPSPQNSYDSLVWFDRSGKPGGSAGEPAVYTSVDLSPDDRRAVATRGVLPNMDLWVIDIDRGGQDRLTSNALFDFFPVWSPDGREIAFSSQGGALGPVDLYRRSSISVGGDTLLAKSDKPNEGSFAEDWSSDGKTIVFSRAAGPTLARAIWYMTLPGNSTPVPYLESQSQNGQAQLSPDGRWLAYASNDSGKAQIVVQSFPDPKTAKVVVTRNGGTEPRWRRDGRELFYLAPDGKLMAVPVKAGDIFEAGTETALFETPLRGGILAQFFRYDVSADGKRFLLIVPTAGASASSATNSTPITAVVNWATALRKK